MTPRAGFGLIALTAALTLGACALRRGSDGAPPAPASVSPEASAALNAVLDAARRLDPAALAAGLHADYSDAQGRGRAELLEAFRRDQERFVSASVEVRNLSGQPQDGGALLRFSFSWRATPRAGDERRLQGGAEWLFAREGPRLKLSSAQGDTFLGVGEAP